MKKRLPLFLMAALLIIALIASCEEPNVKNQQRMNFYFLPEFTQDLEGYLSELNNKYDSYSNEGGTYTEQEFLNRFSLGTYPELGTFENYSGINELSYGTESFSPGDNSEIHMGKSSVIIDASFVADRTALNGPAPVVLLEMLCTDPVIKINGEIFSPESFPTASDAKILTAKWTYDSEPSDIRESYDGCYTVKDNLSEEKNLQFQFGTTPDYFITKATFYKGADIVNNFYSFTKPENSVLILYPFKDTPDFETVIYQVCMPGENRSYYRAAIIVEFENTAQSL